MIPYWARDGTPGLALSCHWDSTETSGGSVSLWQGRRTSALLLCMLKRSPMVLRPEPSVVIMQRVYCNSTATSRSSWGSSWALGDPTGLSCAIWWPLGRSRSPGWSQPRCDRGINAKLCICVPLQGICVEEFFDLPPACMNISLHFLIHVCTRMYISFCVILYKR